MCRLQSIFNVLIIKNRNVSFLIKEILTKLCVDQNIQQIRYYRDIQ